MIYEKTCFFRELCPSRALRARFGRDSTKIAIYGNCNLPEPQSTGTAVYGNRNLREAHSTGTAIYEKKPTGTEIFERSNDL